jgi:hypothetical protein
MHSQFDVRSPYVSQPPSPSCRSRGLSILCSAASAKKTQVERSALLCWTNFDHRNGRNCILICSGTSDCSRQAPCQDWNAVCLSSGRTNKHSDQITQDVKTQTNGNHYNCYPAGILKHLLSFLLLEFLIVTTQSKLNHRIPPCVNLKISTVEFSGPVTAILRCQLVKFIISTYSVVGRRLAGTAFQNVYQRWMMLAQVGTSDIRSAVHSQFDVRSTYVSQPPLLVFVPSCECETPIVPVQRLPDARTSRQG